MESKPLQNYIGTRIGQLLILDCTEYNSFHAICSCGSYVKLLLSQLQQQSVKSCGCARVELIKDARKEVMNRTFGYLTVVKYTERKYKERSLYECLCSCGKTTHATKDELLNKKRILSCGCKGGHTLPIFYRSTKDIPNGTRFGKLTVSNKSDEIYFGEKSYLCNCVCGDTILVTQSDLTKLHITSCGCTEQ